MSILLYDNKTFLANNLSFGHLVIKTYVNSLSNAYCGKINKIQKKDYLNKSYLSQFDLLENIKKGV